MLRGCYQAGILTVLNSASTHPMQLWAEVLPAPADGARIALEHDSSIGQSVVALEGPNLAETFISCPSQASETLGIKLPFMFLLVKNTSRLFSFEVELLDDRGIVRRLRTSNYEARARIGDGVGVVPLRLDEGWNYVTFDIARLLERAYGTAYRETRRITLHASVKLRLVAFADRVVPEDQLPCELRLHSAESSS
ncbi:hypothetical protein GGI04_000319 [Coemansia thaxteri]|uniref:CFA20 domain-containing protein n=1 Tax=Coemansia thaxteri TaxID=2663907 RepID=A0A9W8EGW4_9FUNG|nr:hypothetical protein H4R26_001132 [Coemansia thaxteri]KAJ2009596.1 hypothetical protein GGI04_000319 [Coemansia thaxteri]KAJ2473276.1 hypothetical protein GGI02_000973 [Coemansia sp. RSA 2322]KAJ2486694.1 hypothetical protein EV174_000962 [Coemansia sp. RSA 2320]